MNSEYKFQEPDHVTAPDHEFEEELVNRPSPGAPHPSGWHHLPVGSDYRLRSREVTSSRLEFPDNAVMTVLDSPAEPDHAPLVMEFIVPPGAMPTAAHVHPRQQEIYTVQEGSWRSSSAGSGPCSMRGTPRRSLLARPTPLETARRGG